MSTVNLGRVKANVWYVGPHITGTDTEGTVFPHSYVTNAYYDDLYLSTAASSSGNIYKCLQGGNPSTAVWAYAGRLSISVSLIDNLISDDTDKALTARQGQVLKRILDESGIVPLSVLPGVTEAAYTASIRVLNEASTITVISQYDEVGTYNVTPSGTGSTTTVTFSIGEVLGIESASAVVKEIRSLTPIYEYYLYGYDGETPIAGGTQHLWNSVVKAEQNVQEGSAISDGSEAVKSGIISKVVNGVRNVLWPITHAKAVWFDKTNNRTVHDVIGTEDMGTDANTLTGAIAERGEDIRTLSGSLSPNISALSVYQNRVTLLGGGFIKVGRIVVVDVYVRAGLSTYGGGSILTGAPACAGTNAISAYFNNGSVQIPMGAHVTASGIITISSPSGVDVKNKEIYIAGAYIANS